MKQQTGHDPLSLQEKLDRIAHERETLALLRDLARLGLKDGDAVVRRKDGLRGRLIVNRERAQALVALDDDSEVVFDRAEWRRSD